MPEITDEQYARLLAMDADDGPPVVIQEAPEPAEITATADARVAIIAAQADADVARIEAQAAAEVETMTAAAKLESGADDEDPSLFDSDGNARPENDHWLWRKW